MDKNNEKNYRNLDRELGNMFGELLPGKREGILKIMEAMIRVQGSLRQPQDGTRKGENEQDIQELRKSNDWAR